ncbi:U-box domain-containing protein 32 isoform X1 [Senna tora]|uniref:RING-type E3 ubiquitin transferase n=1 Tax=Senna tora TaxID=362788 RepID=A0A834TIJ4_9FABA|nr:U-box domain-containing protein 32 isoform X1 [Senna tora]
MPDTFAIVPSTIFTCKEVEVFSRVRHPNLLTLIGSCPESRSLVYDYLNNGSLENHLAHKDKTPLPWQIRISIAADICSALIFLHSSKPHIIHGNLKPSKVLLDANFVAKLGAVGISSFVQHRLHSANSSTGDNNPNDSLVYVDPEYLVIGKLTPESDVYSFGIILLQLLTGRPLLGIVRDMKCALEKENLKAVLDFSAGEWPLDQAEQLAYLALRCCEKTRLNRPDLVSEIWSFLEPLRTSCINMPPCLNSKKLGRVPSHFVCPIFQEVMEDPYIAADGFTYEADAIRGWLDTGHNTSPMTNLKLEHMDLVPNYALQNAIQEWQQLQKDQLALAQIHQGVDYSVFGKIVNAKNAKEAWDTLKLAYKGVDKAQKSKLQSLRREYERYEMSGSETIEQYFSRVTDLVNKMRIYRENIPDGKVVEKILHTMPIKYDHVVTTIIESHNLEEMSVAELQGSMESHVSRILEKTEKPVEEALKSHVTLNNAIEMRRGNNDFRQMNHGRGGQNFNFQNRERGRETLFFASNNFFVDENVWYLDTGCSNHMCGKKEMFSSLDESFNSSVKFGNNTNIPILGKGQISIRLKDDTQNFIFDVFHAPGLHHNLLSMEQLSEKSYDMRVHQGFCTLFDKNGRFVAKLRIFQIVYVKLVQWERSTERHFKLENHGEQGNLLK